VYFCLPNIINPMYIQYLRKMFLPGKQNIVGVCNQVTLLSIYSNSSRLLEIIDIPIQVCDIFYITFSFKFINFSLQVFLFCPPVMSASFTPYVV